MTDPELVDLHRRACAAFGERVRAVGAGDWDKPTPCEDWDVRELVNHVVGEDLWTGPMMEGRTIEEVGDRFAGDQLGDDPAAAWTEAQRQAEAAVGAPGAIQRTVHLSFGDTPAQEYVMQLLGDHAIHAWDLATAIGADDRLDPGLVDAIAAWFDDREDMYRGAGVIGPAVEPADPDDPQARLLARFGRR